MNGPEVVSHLNLGARGFTCNVERGNVVKALQRGDLSRGSSGDVESGEDAEICRVAAVPVVIALDRERER